MISDLMINVKDFGPIASGKVDLRPLSIFIGPSNTGKSYLAGLLYALHRTVGSWYNGYLVDGSASEEQKQLPENLVSELEEWLSTLSSNKSTEQAALPNNVCNHLRDMLSYSSNFQSSLMSQVARCFSIAEMNELVRYESESANAVIDLHIPHNGNDVASFHAVLGSAHEQLLKTEVDVKLVGLHPDFVRRLAAMRLLYRSSPLREGDSSRRLNAPLLLFDLASYIFERAFEPLLSRNAHYLPADRTGVMQSHNVVIGSLLQKASSAGTKISDDIQLLSGVVADFLDTLVTRISLLENRSEELHVGGKLAKSLETKVLNGKILVDSGNVAYPYFSYRPDGWKHDLPLMRASSMVSELAPVILYLRYIVDEGDLLIIEEPESHLHPSQQAAFARELASIVNAGVRVVLTTHSEWFLEQIGNLVRASSLPTHKRPEIDEVLLEDDVGAWLFDARTSGAGSEVREVKLDRETGLYPTDYGPVADALYDEHARIFSRLEEEAVD